MKPKLFTVAVRGESAQPSVLTKPPVRTHFAVCKALRRPSQRPRDVAWRGSPRARADISQRPSARCRALSGLSHAFPHSGLRNNRFNSTGATAEAQRGEATGPRSSLSLSGSVPGVCSPACSDPRPLRGGRLPPRRDAPMNPPNPPPHHH